MRPRTISLICFSLLLLLPFVAVADVSAPPGAVYRDYVWRPRGKLVAVGHKTEPFVFPQQVDLDRAVRAQVILEFSNQHLGYPEIALRMDDGEYRAVNFPAAAAALPYPVELAFFHFNPAVDVPLTDLRTSGAHELRMRVGAQRAGGNDWHPPWNPVYSATLRIFYDPALKKHASATLSQPVAGAPLGERVNLQVQGEASGANAAIERVDFVGQYLDVDYEGDGTFDGWHGRLKDGALQNHLGTARQLGDIVVWDTSWVPEQTAPMAVAARVVDRTGLTYVTAAVEGLRLSKRAYRVELARTGPTPRSFTSCQYGTWILRGEHPQSLQVSTPANEITDARVVVTGWNAPSWRRFSLNGIWLDELRTTEGAGNHQVLTIPVRPLAALHTGHNTITTIPDAGRQMDVFFPGVMLLVRSTLEAPKPAHEPKKPDFVNALGMAFSRIEPGFALIGSPESEVGHVWEDRLFRAEVTHAYLIGQTEVTQEQFAAVMGWNPSSFRSPSHPVENVSWLEAVEFCARLSKRDGRHYRLPTEVEWEMAARGGTTSAFSFGSHFQWAHANYDARTPYVDATVGVFRSTTTPVATFPPNPEGLYDVHGNVWEWCSDWYGEYPQGEATDWRGPTEKSRLEPTRILRGGAFNSDPHQARSAFRHRLAPESKQPTIGFRVVISP